MGGETDQIRERVCLRSHRRPGSGIPRNFDRTGQGEPLAQPVRSYFDQLYEWAAKLIKSGSAYACDLTGDQVREYRGTLTEPGKESPWRNRSEEHTSELQSLR